MDYPQIRSEILPFKKQLDSLTRSRTSMELRYFVIGRHEERSRQWKQILMECDEKWRAIQEGEASIRLLDLEIEELLLLQVEIDETDSALSKRLKEIKNEKTKIEVQRKRNQLDRLQIAMQGAAKEVVDFLHIAKTEFSDFMDLTEEQLDEHEREHWVNRYSRQIQVDMTTTGHIQAGNLGSLLQLPPEMQVEIMQKAMGKNHEYMELMGRVQSAHLKKIAEKKVQQIATKGD